MRYDTPVYFQRLVQGAYDASTGDYGADTYKETKRWANVTDSKTDAITVQYGDLKEGSLIVRLQNHYDDPFDRIQIGTKAYKPVSARDLRSKSAFVVAEVQ